MLVMITVQQHDAIVRGRNLMEFLQLPSVREYQTGRSVLGHGAWSIEAIAKFGVAVRSITGHAAF